MLDYIIAIFSPAEMKKPVTKREPKKMSLRLSTDEPWDTIKAQILVKIDAALNPRSINFENYSIAYTIPHIISKPGYPLSSTDDYALLVNRASKPKLVHLHVTPVVGPDDKENQPANDDAEKTKKKRSRANPEDLPGYVNKIAGIQALQGRWKCPKQTTKCFGVYCFVDKEGTHLALSHEMLDCWAMCIVRFSLPSRSHTDISIFQLNHDAIASLDVPPNHRLFDVQPTRLSPVLQRRLENQNKAAPAAPVFNLTIGADVVELLRGTARAPAPPDPAAPAPPYQDILAQPPIAIPPPNPPNRPVPAYDLKCPTLLQPTRLPGVDMTITEFCVQYGLCESMVQKFNTHGYERARVLRFLTVDDANGIRLRLGEIAELRDAIKRWSVVM